MYWKFCGLGAWLWTATRCWSTIDWRRRWRLGSPETGEQATQVVGTSLQRVQEAKEGRLVHHCGCCYADGWWAWADGEKKWWRWVEFWWRGAPDRKEIKWRRDWIQDEVLPKDKPKASSSSWLHGKEEQHGVATSVGGEVAPGRGKRGYDASWANVDLIGPKNEESPRDRFSCYKWTVKI
jgi:hypothetical protein